ncbi:MAG TPA: hypothetical protein P5229_00130 [Candidatus Gracilibacteria bacterium]|nr:hypothetical protein [Candidatus Gracilibacteria bacterium]
MAEQYLQDLQKMLNNQKPTAPEADDPVEKEMRQMGQNIAFENFKVIRQKKDPQLEKQYLEKISNAKIVMSRLPKPIAVYATPDLQAAQIDIQNLLAIGRRFPGEEPAKPADTAVARRAPAAPAPQPRTARPAPVAAAPVPTVGLGAVGIVRGPEVPREEVKPADALDAYGKEQLRNATNNPDKPTRFADITEENVNTRTFAGMPRVAPNSPEYARIKQLTLNTVGEAALGHYLISNNNSVYYIKKGSGIFDVRKVA